MRVWLLHARLALAGCLAVGVLSALRWPQTYTLSYMVIDYHFGFGKRGLLGFVLEHIDRPPYHYVTLAWMAFGVGAAWVGVLFAAAWRDVGRDAGLATAFGVFLLSAGFASLVCDVGRGEHFGLLLAVPCLLMPCGAGWLVARAVLLVCAVLVQEANFLIVAPVVAFDVWLGAVPRRQFRPVLYAAGVLLPAAVLTWYLGNVRTACEGAAGVANFQRMAADFTFQPVPLATLCSDGAWSVVLVFRELWSVPARAVVFPLALSVAVPSVLFNLWLAGRVMRRRGLWIAASVAVTLAPLALLIAASDVVRFTTLIQLTSLLVLVAAARRLGLPVGGTALSGARAAAVVVVLVAFELGSGVTLNDGNQPLKFPFEPLVQRAVDVAQGKAPFVVIPGY